MTTDPQRAEETSTAYGCLAATGVILMPFLLLVELQQFADAVRRVGVQEQASARRWLAVIVAVALASALIIGWRRGKRPLYVRPRSDVPRGLWVVGLLGVVLTRAVSPTSEVWLHVSGVAFFAFLTALFGVVLVSRVAHGALRREPRG